MNPINSQINVKKILPSLIAIIGLHYSLHALAEAGAKSMFADESASVIMDDSGATDTVKPKVKHKAVQSQTASDYADANLENPPMQWVAETTSHSGLQYWIELQEPNGGVRRVTTSHSFHSGDRLKLQIRSNTNGYLYVLNQDSTGQKTPLYPVNGQDSYIQAGSTYPIPDHGAIRFDNVSGQEKVTIALAKYPLTGTATHSAVDSGTLASYRSEDCSGEVGSKGMFTERDGGNCAGATAQPVSYNDCRQSGGVGSKGMFSEAAVDMDCLRTNHGVGSKGMFSEEDSSSAQPASYSVAPTADLDNGSILFVNFYLTHR